MTKGIIYYTDNRLEEPIFSLVQQYLKVGLPITSVSQVPMELGTNFVMHGEPCYLTMIRQITLALENSLADYVFFCEHDVLYPRSHFDFTPSKDNVFYYDTNVYRWDYPSDRAITYDRLISLSGMCANRQFALDHYHKRLETIAQMGLESQNSRDPNWARKWGYEPGTKKRRRGGFSDDEFDTWSAPDPMVDIRHRGTFSPRKTRLDSFNHAPTNWREVKIDTIPGWNLRQLFAECF